MNKIDLNSKAYSTTFGFRKQFISQKLEVSEIVEKEHNYELLVSKDNQKTKLLVYFGKKGVSPIIQGNPESELYKLIRNVVFGEGLFDAIEKDEREPEKYIGTDESGKGDYFGPLVIAAAYIDEKSTGELVKIGVKDSKLFSDNSIKSLEKNIKSVINDNYEVVIINPEKYNQLYESFGNLNKILAWAHSKAIENLVKKTNCTKVISDKFGNEKLISDELRKKDIEVDLFQTTKGERFTAVAAASILARAKVVDWFNYKSREVGIKIPKGGGQAVNVAAKSILAKYDDKYLMKLIKFHFKNSKNIFK